MEQKKQKTYWIHSKKLTVIQNWITVSFDEDSQGDLLVKIDQTKFDNKWQIIDLLATCLSDFAWSKFSVHTMAEDLPDSEDDYHEKAKAEFYRALTK